MSARSRFRLFGRTAPAPAPSPLRSIPPTRNPPGWVPPPRPSGLVPPALSTTGLNPPVGGFRAARSWNPASAVYGDAAPDRRPTDDPPTDPRGFPAVPAVPAVADYTAPVFASFPTANPAPEAPPEARPEPPVLPVPPAPERVDEPDAEAPTLTVPAPRAAPTPAAVEPAAVPGSEPVQPDPADAVAMACVFAADYLSWDEDDHARRGRVLAEHLVSRGSDPARLGWCGTGRQRAEFVVPGRIRPGGDGSVLVDVTVRVTPYRRMPGTVDSAPAHRDASGADESDDAGVPAVAPAPDAPGWRASTARGVRLSVPVVPAGGRWAVDAREEDPATAAADPIDASTSGGR